jgi:NADPH:quinone reductase-like Zn-dependent oxidoreductase
MKAFYRTTYGSPEVLSLKEIPEPKAKANEVLVKVHYSSINRTDTGFLTGRPLFARLIIGLFGPRQHVLGCEFSGIVKAVGAEVTRFKIGDRVFAFNEKQFGGHADVAVMDAEGAIAHIPENIDDAKAAALFEGAHYALVDIRAAKVQAGQNILINGGTGAIGSAAVQICKAWGAKVTAVCHSEHMAKVTALGADKVIAYDQEDFTSVNESFDFIFDAVGKSSFKACKKILAEKGIYISTELGPRNENPFLALTARFRKGKKVLFPIPYQTKEDAIYFAQLAKEGKFSPLIDRIAAFHEIPQLFDYVLSGKKIGNVIIRVNDI